MDSRLPDGDSDDRTRQKSREADRVNSLKSTRFAETQIFAAVFSAAGAALLSLVENAASGFFQGAFDFDLPKIHWLTILTSLNLVYAALSYIIAKLKLAGIIPLLFRVPSWVELRNFGDQRIARVSYVALAAIPLACYFVLQNPLQIEFFRGATIPLNTKISFFIAFFLSLALVAFAVGCPKEFQKKTPFEGVKTVNIVLTSVQRTNINVEDRDEYYDAELDGSKLELRAICWSFYTLGLVLSVSLLLRSAIYVFYA